jgi:hypothetical protein
MTIWRVQIRCEIVDPPIPEGVAVHFREPFTDQSVTHAYCGTLCGSSKLHTDEFDRVTCKRCQTKALKEAQIKKHIREHLSPQNAQL